MEEIKEYLITRYKRTGWPFFKLTELQNRFGKELTKQALNDLFTQGFIAKREGGNTALVELLNTDQWTINVFTSR